MHVDLDAARAARAEARGVHPSVTFRGREFKLVAEAPWDAAGTWNAAVRATDVEDERRHYNEFLSLVLDDPAEASAFLDGRPSGPDLRGVLVACGLADDKPKNEDEKQEPGESSAS